MFKTTNTLTHLGYIILVNNEQTEYCQCIFLERMISLQTFKEKLIFFY
jgi:hypothetical protein